MLPFKVPEPSSSHLVTIEDGFGCSLTLPKYGWITWQENNWLNQFTLEAQDDENLSGEAYKLEVVVQFLRFRFDKLDATKEDLLTMENGASVGQPMIDALHDFFKGERERWGKSPGKKNLLKEK